MPSKGVQYREKLVYSRLFKSIFIICLEKGLKVMCDNVDGDYP